MCKVDDGPLRKYKGARGTSYTVRWRVNGQERQRTFGTQKLADSFRSELHIAARAGEAFSGRTGLPRSLSPSSTDVTWYRHACDFVDHKWPHASARHRKGIAEALTNVTTALVTNAETSPPVAELRRALFGWAFNTPARKCAPPDEDFFPVEWIEAHSVPLQWLRDARTLSLDPPMGVAVIA